MSNNDIRFSRTLPSEMHVDELELLVPDIARIRGKTLSGRVSLSSWKKGDRVKASEFSSSTLKYSIVRVRGRYYPFMAVLACLGVDTLNDWFKNLVRSPDDDLLEAQL